MRNDSAHVNELLRQGAQLEWRAPWGGFTPLAEACCNGSYEAAEALCAHGAELDARDHWQSTPLMYAAVYGHPKICAMLLALGADPSLKDCDGQTALDKEKSFSLARQKNEPECLAPLQQHQQELLLQQQTQAEVDAVATPAPAEPEPAPAALTPAQQRQQAAAEQRERERVARANGTTVGLPAPPPLRMLYVSSFSRNREKTRKNVHLPQKSIFPSETEKSQPP